MKKNKYKYLHVSNIQYQPLFNNMLLEKMIRFSEPMCLRAAMIWMAKPYNACTEADADGIIWASGSNLFRQKMYKAIFNQLCGLLKLWIVVIQITLQVVNSNTAERWFLNPVSRHSNLIQKKKNPDYQLKPFYKDTAPCFRCFGKSQLDGSFS